MIVCVSVCASKQGLGCMQMVHEPTFQLGPQYKYPWLIGMWRLLAQKGSSAWRISRTPLLTHACSQAAGRIRKAPPVAPLFLLFSSIYLLFFFLHSGLFSFRSLSFHCVSRQLQGLTLHLKEAFGWTRLEF